MKKIKLFRIVFLLYFLPLCQSGSQGPDNNSSIFPDINLKKTIEYLSSPELKGRLPGTEGYNLAAQYMADKFEALLLRAGNQGYFQNFEVEYNNIYGPCKFNLIENGTIKKTFKLGEEYIFKAYTGSGHVTGPVVFAGYGLSQPEIGYDDYAGIDVNGKIVICFTSRPGWNVSGQSWANTSTGAKAKVAAAHGAVGIIYVNKPSFPFKIFGVNYRDRSITYDPDFPQVYIELSSAEELFYTSGKTLTELQENIDQSRKPVSTELDYSVEIEVHSEYNRRGETKNVIAILDGKDSVLKDEYILIGAHLDHLGPQGDEVYFPGANDNASGSAVLLKTVELLKKDNYKPKRTIVFVLFSAEESGVFGAEYYVNNPPFPLEKIRCMINLDCVGYGDELRIYGRSQFPEMWSLVDNLDKNSTNILVDQSPDIPSGTDAYPFFQHNIPIVYFEATNTFDYTHTPADRPETLNLPLMEKTTRLLVSTIKQIAE